MIKYDDSMILAKTSKIKRDQNIATGAGSSMHFISRWITPPPTSASHGDKGLFFVFQALLLWLCLPSFREDWSFPERR